MCSKRPIIRHPNIENVTSDLDEEPLEEERDKVDLALDATKEIFNEVV